MQLKLLEYFWYCKGGANREATDKEIQGGTYADGVGTAVAGVFGGLPTQALVKMLD